jgi:hypothetical protein
LKRKRLEVLHDNCEMELVAGVRQGPKFTDLLDISALSAAPWRSEYLFSACLARAAPMSLDGAILPICIAPLE